MSDDLTDCDSAKEQPTGIRETGKGIIRAITPLGTRADPDTESKSNNDSDGMDRRTYMLMAGGLATAALGGSVGSAASTTSTTEVNQLDAYGYGGSSSLSTTETTLAVGSLSGETLTQTEANAEREEAMEVFPDTLVEAELEPATVDWFGFEAAAGDPITVAYERDDPVGVTGLVIYGPDGSFKEKLFVGTDSQHMLSTAATETGPHFLQVVDVESGDGPYAFAVLLEEPDEIDDDEEEELEDDDGDDGDEDMDDGDDTGQSPYGGTPRTVPGTIQAQEFDDGGQSVAYYDTTEENQGGEYRPDEYVDIELSDDSTNEYNVGFTAAGEWLEFTVDVTPGVYDIEARVATERDDRELTLSLDGGTLTTISAPNTGGWFDWETVSVGGVEIEDGGERVLRLAFLEDGLNLNWIRFVEQDDEENDYGSQTYGEYEYGGLSQ